MKSEMEGKKYCRCCGEIIDEDCVICPKCGKQIELLKNESAPIIVNNSSCSSASSVVLQSGRRKKKYNHLLDFVLICVTGGLWIIWMLIRPKYEY